MAISDRIISAPPACVQAQREGRFLRGFMGRAAAPSRHLTQKERRLPSRDGRRFFSCGRAFCARQGAYISPLGSRVMRAWTASAGSMPWLTMALTVWTMGMSTR